MVAAKAGQEQLPALPQPVHNCPLPCNSYARAQDFEHWTVGVQDSDGKHTPLVRLPV